VSRLLLTVDFDGTVVRGDAPVRCYARLVAEAMRAGAAESFLDAVGHFLAHGAAAAADLDDPAQAAALRGAMDAWEAVRDLAACHGLPPQAVDDAFTRCRDRMVAPSCEVGLVLPLMDALAGLRPRARIMLVTNSPQASMLPLLDRLGIASSFDDIVTGARKPGGLRRLVQCRLAADAPGQPWRLFSLGDHYRNDIEPAIQAGAAAGYIDRFGRADGPATARAARAEDLLPALRAWADNPAAAARPPAQHPADRPDRTPERGP